MNRLIRSFLLGLLLETSHGGQEARAEGWLVSWGGPYPQLLESSPYGPVDFVSISAGLLQTCAVTGNGEFEGWGGVGTSGATQHPSHLRGLIAVSAGGYHSLALKSNGTVVAWGSETYGQSIVPDGLTNVVAIAAGAWHSIALRADGTLVEWGSENHRLHPSLNVDLVAVAAGGNLVGAIHSLALKRNGTVIGWGDNGSGRQSEPPSWLRDVIAIAAGGEHSLALRKDGTVVAWGANGHGQSSVPADLSNVVAIAAGERHSMALTASGRVVAWGSNEQGQCDISPFLIKVKAISAGRTHSIAFGDLEVHRAVGRAEIRDGKVAAIVMTDEGFRYTNAPLVRIVGGGGSGATARAIVDHGIVVSVVIDDPGHDYTEPPQIKIASPDQPPQLAIRVATVFVDLKLILGNRYQLSSSRDMATWTAVAAPFVAEDELLTQEFEVRETGQYFRVYRLP